MHTQDVGKLVPHSSPISPHLLIEEILQVLCSDPLSLYLSLFQVDSASWVWMPVWRSTKLSACTTTRWTTTPGMRRAMSLYAPQSSVCTSELGSRTRWSIAARVCLSIRATTSKYPLQGVYSVHSTLKTQRPFLARRPLWYCNWEQVCQLQ